MSSRVWGYFSSMLSRHLLKTLSQSPSGEEKIQSCSLDKDFLRDSLRPLHVSEHWFCPCLSHIHYRGCRDTASLLPAPQFTFQSGQW